jgi:hypothetical protein
MGIYLGQLPPAEIARLKAELAETLIANFCYPRFFDHRTETLQMRPVDRTKRQEVWLYLSSVDFTAWNRVDLMSADFQHQIERLFIQFVQRNRNFFGEQGRRRMFDIRVQISACAVTVTQGLRNHLTGQKQNNPPFGSPRSVVSWSTPAISARPEPTWEQLSASTMILQQQLQELRGEVRIPVTPVANDGRDVRAQRQSVPSAAGMAEGIKAGGAGSSVQTGYPMPANPNIRRSMPTPVAPVAPAASVKPVQAERADYDLASVVHQPTMSIPPVSPRPAQPAAEVRSPAGSMPPSQPVATPVASAYRAPQPSVEIAVPVAAQSIAPAVRQTGAAAQPYETRTVPPTVRRTEVPSYNKPLEQATPTAPVAPAASMATPTRTAPAGSGRNGNGATEMRSPTSPLGDTAPTPAVFPTGNAAMKPPMAAPRRTPSPTQPTTSSSTLTASGAGSRDMMTVGEDDTAIFEQLRHQLVVWLRIEAITAGLEISSQSPTQLLELLRQQARIDETRLQVVSTLLNLANQVIKTGLVSVLDYKQALMFHLMHTRRQ